MGDRLVFYWDRADTLNLIDPDAIPHFDGLHPVLDIVIDVINAGYEGVVIDEQRLSNGRYIQALNVNLATPEGQIISAIRSSFKADGDLPAVSEVLQQIKNEDDAKGNVK